MIYGKGKIESDHSSGPGPGHIPRATSRSSGLSCRRELSVMIVSDQQREENYQEYQRLLQNPDYIDVTFDEVSGGVSAVHKDHRLDKQKGVEGCRCGIYELKTAAVLRGNGHSIILEKESTEVGVRQYDGLLDGIPCEIKSVEKMGRWTIRTKISNAIRQGADTVILYFPDASIYSEEKVQSGWEDLLAYSDPDSVVPEIDLLCVADGKISRIKKPSR